MDILTLDINSNVKLSPVQKVMKRYHRRDLGMTHRRMAEELCEAAGAEVITKQALQYWEAGVSTPRIRRFIFGMILVRTMPADWRYQFCNEMLAALEEMFGIAIVVPE